jgi:Flp pilus assembly protein TadD
LQKAVQASPKNRFAWHVWGVFEANIGNIEKARKLLTIGHALNPRDAVLLQSLALLEYRHSTANLARVLFRKASELDPRHQPVWIVRCFFTQYLDLVIKLDQFCVISSSFEIPSCCMHS